MSFIKNNLPMIGLAVVLSIAGGLYSGHTFHKGYDLGRKHGFDIGEACGRLEEQLDNIEKRIKTNNANNEKEEASN